MMDALFCAVCGKKHCTCSTTKITTKHKDEDGNWHTFKTPAFTLNPEDADFIIGDLKTQVNRLRAQVEEVEEIRKENTLSVMPLIGPLLAAWDDLPNDIKGDPEISTVAILLGRIALRMDPNGDDKG
jgi:hypothetical protein